ncbi:MAG TPA: hypothetical protein VF013_04130 [Candidatus Limnocylindria bacterium]
MPFLPFVLLLAWQAVSKSASFALGWATALYFGQVPGKQGRVLAVISLLAAGWVIVLVGFAVPLLVGAALDATGVIPRNFDVQPLQVIALGAAVVLTPPLIAGATVWVEFHEDRSPRQWLRMIPFSYPATASLGMGVLMMVALTPFAIVQRLRNKRSLLQAALSLKDGADDEHLADAVRQALHALGIDRVEVTEADGFLTWPMRAVGFAARHLLGAVVRGEPMRLRADGLELYAYATNVAIIGPEQKAYRARAAIERELALRDAYLTWAEDSQAFEDDLADAFRTLRGEPDRLRTRLDEIQQRIDGAALNTEEWNVLYRIRLQLEEAARNERDDQREKVRMAKPAISTKPTKTTSSRAPQLVRRSG